MHSRWAWPMRRTLMWVAGLVCLAATLATVPVVVRMLQDPECSTNEALRVAGSVAVMFVAAVVLFVVAYRSSGNTGRTIDPKVLEEVLRIERESSTRIAEQLHDTAVQSLVYASYIARGEGQGDQDLRESLSEQLVAAEREVRDVILNAREPDIQSSGFGASCQHLHLIFDVRDGLEIHWDWAARSTAMIPAVAAGLAYRFLQETLSNVAQHAGVGHAYVTVLIQVDRLIVSVQDNGSGFVRGHSEIGATGRSRGLQVLQARTSLMGGRMSVTTGAGDGTTVTLRVPIDHDVEQTMVRLGYAPGDMPAPMHSRRLRVEKRTTHDVV